MQHRGRPRGKNSSSLQWTELYPKGKPMNLQYLCTARLWCVTSPGLQSSCCEGLQIHISDWCETAKPNTHKQQTQSITVLATDHITPSHSKTLTVQSLSSLQSGQSRVYRFGSVTQVTIRLTAQVRPVSAVNWIIAHMGGPPAKIFVSLARTTTSTRFFSLLLHCRAALLGNPLWHPEPVLMVLA